MKKLVPLLLLLIAVFYGTPQLSCICKQEAVLPVASSDIHECCKGQEQSPCLATNEHLSKNHSCCGMVKDAKAAMGSLVKSVTNLKSEKATFYRAFDTLAQQEQSLCLVSAYDMNRAPPRVRGLGTSDTYLFKRTLLI